MEKRSSTSENARDILRLRWIYFGVQVGFKLTFEILKGGWTHKFYQEENSKWWEHQKKAVIKLFDRLFE